MQFRNCLCSLSVMICNINENILSLKFRNDSAVVTPQKRCIWNKTAENRSPHNMIIISEMELKEATNSMKYYLNCNQLQQYLRTDS